MHYHLGCITTSVALPTILNALNRDHIIATTLSRQHYRHHIIANATEASIRGAPPPPAPRPVPSFRLLPREPLGWLRLALESLLAVWWMRSTISAWSLAAAAPFLRCAARMNGWSATIFGCGNESAAYRDRWRHRRRGDYENGGDVTPNWKWEVCTDEFGMERG